MISVRAHLGSGKWQQIHELRVRAHLGSGNHTQAHTYICAHEERICIYSPRRNMHSTGSGEEEKAPLENEWAQTIRAIYWFVYCLYLIYHFIISSALRRKQWCVLNDVFKTKKHKFAQRINLLWKNSWVLRKRSPLVLKSCSSCRCLHV